jgi:pyrimidine-nucleoside phosphorylase/thymidine phosphorylase
MLTPTMLRQLIAHKRDGHAIDRDSLLSLIAAYMADAVEEAVMAAFLMACVLRGLNDEETAALTQAFVASGERLETGLAGPVLDKHSSGGVADTTSLIVVPWVAACGVPVAKLAGRALGHTGGTLDKLETVPGVRTDMEPTRFLAQLRDVGCVIAAQSERLVPADKRIYALRDRTATVPSVGLIAASIVSKKIAGGADAIVYDIKAGNGAFMRTPEEARELADMIVRTTNAFGKNAVAFVTDMNEPLGKAIGTTLEVLEARDFLRGTERDARLQTVCFTLAQAMLRLAGHAEPEQDLTCVLASGAAYARFERMLEAQGARPNALASLLPSTDQHVVTARADGFVAEIDTTALGDIARDIEERHDSAGGIRVTARIGTFVRAGDVLATVYGTRDKGDDVASTFTLAPHAPPPRPLFPFDAM